MLRRFLVTALLLLVGWSVAHAQTAPAANEIMLSWRSNGFAPAGYAGRVAASGGGQVLVTAEAISGGRALALSGYEVRWFVNDELYQSGMGLQSITYFVDESHQDSFDVRVEIVGAPFANAMANMSVPLAEPQAVISQTSRILHQGDNVFEAVPYSFNVTNASDLVYQWSVNGQAPNSSENPRRLTVSYDGDPSDPLEIGLGISHPQDGDEAAGARLTMTPVTR